MYKTFDNGVWLDFTKQEKNDYLQLREYITQDRVDYAQEFLYTFSQAQRKKLVNAQKIDKLSNDQTIYESYALLLARGRPMLEYLVSEGLELQISNVNYAYVWRSGFTEHYYTKLHYLLENGIDFGASTREQFLFTFRQSSWARTGTGQVNSPHLEDYYSLLLCLAKRLTGPEVSEFQYDFFSTMGGSYAHLLKEAKPYMKEDTSTDQSPEALTRAEQVLIELLDTVLDKGLDINQGTVIRNKTLGDFSLYPIHEIIGLPRSGVLTHLIERSSLEQVGLFIDQLRENEALDLHTLDYLEQYKIKKEKALLEALSPEKHKNSVLSTPSSFSHKMKI